MVSIWGHCRFGWRTVRGTFGLAADANIPVAPRPLMQLDFEIQRSTRRCAATDRPLEPGDECYAVLEVHGADVVRKDYSREAWAGPPEQAFGWWRYRVPEPNAKKLRLAPNDVLLELFDQLAEQPDGQDMRYVLALLLVRRRVFRTENLPDAKPAAPADVEMLAVYCPKRDAMYEVPVVMPGDERIEEIQQQLGELLLAGSDDEDKETGRQGDKEIE